MNEEEVTQPEEVITTPFWDAAPKVEDWSNNLYAAAFDYVENLVTEDGRILQAYPFVPGVIDTESAFEVLQQKIEDSFAEDSEESIENITSVVFLSFMMGAWVASAQTSPSGYNLNLTKEQIAQVVQTWVSISLQDGE